MLIGAHDALRESAALHDSSKGHLSWLRKNRVLGELSVLKLKKAQDYGLSSRSCLNELSRLPFL